MCPYPQIFKKLPSITDHSGNYLFIAESQMNKRLDGAFDFRRHCCAKSRIVTSSRLFLPAWQSTYLTQQEIMGAPVPN